MIRTHGLGGEDHSSGVAWSHLPAPYPQDTPLLLTACYLAGCPSGAPFPFLAALLGNISLNSGHPSGCSVYSGGSSHINYLEFCYGNLSPFSIYLSHYVLFTAMNLWIFMLYFSL